MRISDFSLFLLLFICSCSGDKSNFKVEVNVSDFQDEMIYLARRSITGSIVIDSTLPGKSGKYLLKGYTSQPDFFVVYSHPGNYINLIIHPGDDFKVLANAPAFDRNYLVEGSSDSRLIQKMVNMQIRTMERITELSERYESSKNTEHFGSIKAEIDSNYNRIFNEHKLFTINLIKENPNSLATLMALYQQLGRNAPVFDYKKDIKFYEMVDSSLSPIYPNSEAVIDLNRKVTELKDMLRLEPGSPAPYLALPDSAGNLIRLSDFKGNKAIIFFWASWSSQSLKEMNQMESVHKDIGSNVIYYQVSLDRTRESWLRNATSGGIHVSDLKYWDSPVVKTYDIDKLPVAYLVDEDGNIVEKATRIEDLVRKLVNME